jgi:excisionase family DNA binding protein
VNSPNTQSESQLLRPSDVARRLSVSRSWVYGAAADGRIPSLRLGGPDGPLRFIETDIEEWIAQARDEWQPGTGASHLSSRDRSSA